MLVSSRAPKYFWGEAVLTANFVLNKVPHKKTFLTPFELWKKYKRNLNFFKVWGCLAYVRLPNPERPKLGGNDFYLCIFGLFFIQYNLQIF